MSKSSSERILAAMPPKAPDLDRSIRELGEKVEKMQKAFESFESPDMYQSLTRREAALFLKVHPQRLHEFEILGLKYYQAGKGHTYTRRELIDFRENVLRNLRGLTLRISKPREKKTSLTHN